MRVPFLRQEDRTKLIHAVAEAAAPAAARRAAQEPIDAAPALAAAGPEPQ
jgi:hypothetical protein